jgi:hypothetical protein
MMIIGDKNFINIHTFKALKIKIRAFFYLSEMKNLERKIKRQQQVEQGAYDGRFRSKVVPDKKKQQSKNWARNGKNYKKTDTV